MNRVLEAFAKAWQLARDVVTVLRPCRFSALVVAAGAALLLSGQGLEFTVRLPSEGLGKTLWFDVCVFLWAFQSWYWARLLRDLTFGDRDGPLAHPRAGRIKAIIVETPRVLAAGSYLVAVTVCAFAGTWLIGALLAVEGALFYAFLVLRRTLVATFAGNATGWRHAATRSGSSPPPTTAWATPISSRCRRPDWPGPATGGPAPAPPRATSTASPGWGPCRGGGRRGGGGR